MMIKTLKNFFGIVSTADLKALASQGAILLDVRTAAEFKQGHIHGATNISVDELPKNIGRLNKNKPIITCCASGMRSGRAAKFLKDNGFQALNGGSWGSLQYKLK
jgi:rhodanese-related sulfurtransferase